MKHKFKIGIVIVFIAIFLFDSFPSISYAAIQFVQVVSSTTGLLTSSITANITPTAGNTLIVSCSEYGGGAPTTFTVSDPTNGTYTEDAFKLRAANSNALGIYRFSNVAGTNVTTTCSNGSTAGGYNLFIAEYSGLSNTNPVDASSSASGSSADPDPGIITTSNANDLIFGSNVANVVPGSPTMHTGFTERANTSQGAEPSVIFDQIVSATGQYQASSTWPTSGVWVAAQVAYKAATAVAGQVNHLIRGSGRTRGNTGR